MGCVITMKNPHYIEKSYKVQMYICELPKNTLFTSNQILNKFDKPPYPSTQFITWTLKTLAGV